VIVSPYFQQLINQTILPDVSRGGSAILAPSMVPARAQAVHKRLEHVFTNVPDNFTFCVKPTRYPVSATLEVDIVISGLNFEGEIGAEGSFIGEAYFGDLNDGVYELSYLTHTSDYEGFPAIVQHLQGTTVVSISTLGWPPGTYNFLAFDSVALVWVDYGTFVAGSAGTANNIVPFTINANDASAFRIDGQGAGTFVPGPVQSSSTFGPPQLVGTETMNHEPIHLDLPSLAERWRITGMAVKATFFGSTLNNEGEIAIARTYPGWTPFSEGASPWDNIAQLPFQSYDGRLEFGAHAFWLPTDVAELNFRNVNEEFTSLDLTRIWGCIKGADPTASMRLELDLVYEFYSPLPEFSKNPVPYYDDKVGRLYFNLGMVTCVGDNPGHLARLASVGKKVAGATKTAAETALLFV